jgi:hypothetical protein
MSSRAPSTAAGRSWRRQLRPTIGDGHQGGHQPAELVAGRHRDAVDAGEPERRAVTHDDPVREQLGASRAGREKLAGMSTELSTADSRVSELTEPSQTISDTVRRGDLRPLARGIYTTDTTSTPEAIVARHWHTRRPTTRRG